MNTAVIGLGSNIEPEANIKEAKRILAKESELLGETKLVLTDPIGFEDQPDFLNGAILIRTAMSHNNLKQYLKHIELALGRNLRSRAYRPRTIDLDIVVWNGEIVDRDFYTRDFLRSAVLELLPNLKMTNT